MSNDLAVLLFSCCCQSGLPVDPVSGLLILSGLNSDEIEEKEEKEVMQVDQPQKQNQDDTVMLDLTKATASIAAAREQTRFGFEIESDKAAVAHTICTVVLRMRT